MISNYIIFDTETSGLNPKIHEILSISAIKADSKTGEILDEFHSLVHPSETCVFDEGALKVNGLKMDDIMSAPEKPVVYSAFLNFIGTDTPLMGYNVAFDRRMLEADLNRIGYINAISEKRYIDILPMVRKRKLPTASNKLSVVCEHLGYNAKFHDSLEDCRATNFIFRKLFLHV